MATSLKLLFEDIIQENEAVGSMKKKKKFRRCFSFQGLPGRRYVCVLCEKLWSV
jgi:hypothetical protein